jgi:predicted ATPase
MPIAYVLNIGLYSSKRPFVKEEGLFYKKGAIIESSFSLFYSIEGKVSVWKGVDNEMLSQEDILKKFKDDHINNKFVDFEYVELEDKRKLAIATLGSFKQHPRISAFRRFMEGWYLSYFTPDAARSQPMAETQRHLNVRGDNLGNVVQFMEREHPDKFQSILTRIASKIPSIDKIGSSDFI